MSASRVVSLFFVVLGVLLLIAALAENPRNAATAGTAVVIGGCIVFAGAHIADALRGSSAKP